MLTQDLKYVFPLQVCSGGLSQDVSSGHPHVLDTYLGWGGALGHFPSMSGGSGRPDPQCPSPWPASLCWTCSRLSQQTGVCARGGRPSKHRAPRCDPSSHTYGSLRGNRTAVRCSPLRAAESSLPDCGGHRSLADDPDIPATLWSAAPVVSLLPGPGPVLVTPNVSGDSEGWTLGTRNRGVCG